MMHKEPPPTYLWPAVLASFTAGVFISLLLSIPSMDHTGCIPVEAYNKAIVLEREACAEKLRQQGDSWHEHSNRLALACK